MLVVCDLLIDTNLLTHYALNVDFFWPVVIFNKSIFDGFFEAFGIDGQFIVVRDKRLNGLFERGLLLFGLLLRGHTDGVCFKLGSFFATHVTEVARIHIISLGDDLSVRSRRREALHILRKLIA